MINPRIYETKSLKNGVLTYVHSTCVEADPNAKVTIVDAAGREVVVTQTVPCKLCQKPTTGSVGAAGIRWPFLCQPCKDGEDAAAMLHLAGKQGISLALAAKHGYVFPTAEQMRDPTFTND